MTKDHKPQDPEETKRIEAAGHDVIKGMQIVNGKTLNVPREYIERLQGQRTYEYRIDNIISVSRSIGDASFKDNYGEDPENQAITCIPDITEDTLKSGEFLVLACDGLWDVMTIQEVVDFVQEKRKDHDLDTVAQLLVQEAIQQRQSTDNVTVVIVAKQ